MLDELVKSVLVLLASFLVKYIFSLIGVAIDEATFNAIVAALVTFLLGLLGYEAARTLRPQSFRAR